MVLILKFKYLFNWFSWEKQCRKSLHAIWRFIITSNCKFNLPDKVSQWIWRYCSKEVYFFVQFWLPCNLQWSIQVHHQAPTSLVSTIMLNNFLSTDQPRTGFTVKRLPVKKLVCSCMFEFSKTFSRSGVSEFITPMAYP